MVKTIAVYVLRCGSCGFAVSTLNDERARAGMLDHLLYVHAGSRVATDEGVGDTETTA